MRSKHICQHVLGACVSFTNDLPLLISMSITCPIHLKIGLSSADMTHEIVGLGLLPLVSFCFLTPDLLPMIAGTAIPLILYLSDALPSQDSSWLPAQCCFAAPP